MSHGRPSELADLTEGRATAVYWCPARADRLPHLLIAAPGPKPFIRVWLDDTTFRVNSGAQLADWTWFKPDDAICLNIDPESDTVTDEANDDRGRQTT